MPHATRSASDAAPGVRSTRNDAPPARAHDKPASPATDEAKRAIDASRQAGVVNPGELSKEVRKAYDRSPQHGAAVHAAVDAQLSPRDRASLNEHLSATLGATAGARGVQPDNVTVYRVEGEGNRRVNVGTDGSVDIPAVHTRRGPERNLYLNFDNASRARTFMEQRQSQFGDNTIKSFEVPRSFLNELRATAVPESVRSAHADKPVIADPTKARDQFGLAGEQIGKLREVTVQGSGVDNARPSALAQQGRLARQGAIVGAATDAALTTAGALRDGRISGGEAGNILASTARGAAVGGTYAVTEHGLVKAADRVLGPTIHRATAATAAHLGAVDAVASSAAVRTVATRLAGAGAAGAVISAGFSAYENRDGLARGDSQAIGRVAGDTVVGAAAALSGAAAGAAIGSVVPGVGTAVGAVVGLGVGFAADYVMRAGGVDKAVAQAVSSGVDALKSGAAKVAGWLGW